jgi:ribonuclease P protein component
MAPASPPMTAEADEPHFGLPRSQRVRKRAEFVRIQGSPVRVPCRHLLLLLALSVDDGGSARRSAELCPQTPGDDGGSALPPARLGVVASRKVGPAVVRNRAKRLVREAFRLHPEVFPAGLDVVVIVRPGTHLLGLAELAAEITGAAPTLAKRARELRGRGRR